MTTVVVKNRVPYLLQPFKYARANIIPQGLWAKNIADVANYLRLNQRKQVFSSSGAIRVIPAAGGVGSRVRWAFRCHTGYGVKRFVVAGLMAQTPTTGTAAAYTRLTCVPVGGGTTVTVDITYGNVDAAATVNDSWDEFFDFAVVTPTLVENTTYECVFEDFQNARIAQATVWEEALGPSTDNGYILPEYSLGQNIYDSYREELYMSLTEMWCRNAAPLIAYSTPTGASPPGTTSATQTNLVDRVSTAWSANTPGFYSALQYCRTLGLATVPCVFAVKAFTSAGAGGSVQMRDSSGTLVTLAGIGTTNQWYTTTVNMPATNDKRDLLFATTAGTLRVHAVALYQYL